MSLNLFSDDTSMYDEQIDSEQDVDVDEELETDEEEQDSENIEEDEDSEQEEKEDSSDEEDEEPVNEEPASIDDFDYEKYLAELEVTESKKDPIVPPTSQPIEPIVASLQTNHLSLETEISKYQQEVNDLNYDEKIYNEYSSDWEVAARLDYKDKLDQRKALLLQKQNEIGYKQNNHNRQMQAYQEAQARELKEYTSKRHSTIIKTDDVEETQRREELLFLMANQEFFKAQQNGKPITPQKAIDQAAILAYKLGLKPNKTTKNVKHNRRNIAVTNTSGQSSKSVSPKSGLGKIKAQIEKDGLTDYAKKQYGSVENYAKMKLAREQKRR